MPITAIRQLRNLSDHAVQLSNLETRSDPTVTVMPGEAAQAVNMWVPWSPDGKDFGNHHLSVGVWPPGPQWGIWQADRSDGDHVRFGEGVAGLILEQELEGGKQGEIAFSSST